MTRLAWLLFGVVFCLGASASERLPSYLLTDAQLDSIHGGYVLLEIEARAEASGGPQPIAISTSMTNVAVGEPQDDGFVYTQADGYGFAFASGEFVYTDVDVNFQTDEEVLAFEYHRIGIQSAESRSAQSEQNRSPSGKPVSFRLLTPSPGAERYTLITQQLYYASISVTTRQPANSPTTP